MSDTSVGRESILDAARAVVIDQGASGLTVRAVTQRAGCSTTGIYTYFGGKQGLLDALYAEAFAEFHLALYINAVPGNEVARAHHAMRAYRDWALANASRYLLIFAFRASGYTPSPELVESTQPTFEALVDLFSELVRVGALEGDARAIATHLWATQHGYVMLELTGPGTLTDDPVAAYQEGVSAALRGYNAAPGVVPAASR
ncbi:TetR/AcrR family transcriptional regulator [Demequina oxidasica]|uniref:TetR/AcrR family transcriptional regulator n=1 Tax=Demequina oxidasica TaxID=676199 RepID=UPI000780C755|nr:TetR/AcrR family transcriptional regulator [Demequina oxidasica]